ncbi:MAG TPA: maleylpyruvate isomerase family mycothiol-dependent enzyme [Acidimicrobiales bacterium]|nr:maleylpyruvate isomerase family mycothiol-dependent enzyme [Acidimicrobiales bacterium]
MTRDADFRQVADLQPDADLQPFFSTQYRALADSLVALSKEDWDTPSMCEGWGIREVIAHLTMPARYDEETFIAELKARQFDFSKLSNEIALRDGQFSTEQLLADLRSEKLHRWVPPGGSYRDSLNHVVIHSLDAIVPLGFQLSGTNEVFCVVLDHMTKGGVYERFGTQITGRRLEATDLHWSWGQGGMLRGTASDLILVLAGRRLAGDRFDGLPL